MPAIRTVRVGACCRGVSTAIAQELLKAFGSLDGVFAAPAASLAAVKVGKQSFGKVKAERLHGLMHSKTLLPLAKDPSTKTTVQTEPSFSDAGPGLEPAEHTTECD